jgi:DNA gyrase subunit B
MTKYTEREITFFKSDLEKIRAKAAMYIGPVDDAGIFTILREAMDNAVDEARAGRNSLVHVLIDPAGAFWVVDAGVGIPVKPHPKAKISTLTHVLTALQSSGKMSGDAYKSAIGTHGVGIKATNALSKSFEVWTYRKDAGGWHHTSFERGVEKTKPKKVTAGPKLPNGTKPKLGTVVRFVPDEQIFAKSKLQKQQLLTWCEMTAFMNAGLRIVVTPPQGKPREWFSKRGILEYLEKRLVELKATALNKKPLIYTSGTLELALSFGDVEGSAMQFFTNTIRNQDEGFHAESFYRALVESLKPFKGKLEYTPTDLREGLVGVLNYKIDAPQFSSQTKEKLVDVRMKEPCYKECLEMLTKYWQANKTLAKDLVSRAAELRKKTADFLKDKKLIKQVKGASRALSAKMADVSGSKVPFSERELFLVEGDSAGGTAKLARDKSFQATFALRGKPLNVMEATKDKVNGNTEIAGIFAGIGLDLSAADPLAKIRFGKIVYLADPDTDGCHIRTLLHALFWRYLPDLFKQGRIYMVLSPEYLTKYKGKTYFGANKEALYKLCGTEKLDIRHIKGWGEISAEDMQAIAFTKGQRQLLQVNPPEDKKGVARFQALMGKDSNYRKQLLGVN